jgi:hypothetical protein
MRKELREISLWMKIQGTWLHFLVESIEGNCVMNEKLRKLVPLPQESMQENYI